MKEPGSTNRFSRGFERPPAIRSLVMLEACASMISERRKPSFGNQVEISVRPQGSPRWHARVLASDTPDGVLAVSDREADVAIVNPSAMLTLAHRGTGVFARPLPVRAIAVLPQPDFVIMAVPPSLGVTHLEELAEKEIGLRVSLRGNEPGHSILAALTDIMGAAGCPIHALESWGGQVFYDEGLGHAASRLGGVAAGERDAVFDEAAPVWAGSALEAGLTFLSLREETIAELNALGYRRATISPDVLPGLDRELVTVDFSGWPIFCHAEATDELVETFCAGLLDRRERIPWDGPGPLPLDRMTGRHPDAPLDVPLHRVAARFWASHGLL
jgi:TRAP-type uncharacterized transport system substrate-binding protein